MKKKTIVSLAIALPAALLLALGVLHALSYVNTIKEKPMQYTLSQGDLALNYDPCAMTLRVVNHNGTRWDWLPKACYVELAGGKRLAFEKALCESEELEIDGVLVPCKT
ncbi:MAG: hypothetical protein FWC27_15935 [Firmicutes bacterium]|nr:hypothetical protein [Bacillota bacterium]